MPAPEESGRPIAAVQSLFSKTREWRLGVITNADGVIDRNGLVEAENMELNSRGLLRVRGYLSPIEGTIGDGGAINGVNKTRPHYVQPHSFFSELFDHEGPFLAFVRSGVVYTNREFDDSIAQDATDPYFYRNYVLSAQDETDGVGKLIDMIQIATDTFLLYGIGAPLTVWSQGNSDLHKFAGITNRPGVSVTVPASLRPAERETSYTYYVRAGYSRQGTANSGESFSMGETEASPPVAFHTNKPVSEWGTTQATAPSISITGTGGLDNTEYALEVYLGSRPDRVFSLTKINRRIASSGGGQNIYLDGASTRNYDRIGNPQKTAPDENTSGAMNNISAAAALGGRRFLGGNGVVYYDAPDRLLDFSPSNTSGKFRVGGYGERIIKIIDYGSRPGRASMLVFTARTSGDDVYADTKVFSVVENYEELHGLPYVVFEVNRVAGVPGTVAPESVVGFDGGVAYLAHNGFYGVFDDGGGGIRAERISGNIQGCVDKILPFVLDTTTRRHFPGIHFDNKLFWRVWGRDGQEIWHYYLKDNRGAWMKPWTIEAQTLFIAPSLESDNSNLAKMYVEVNESEGRIQGIGPEPAGSASSRVARVRSGIVPPNDDEERQSNPVRGLFDLANLSGRIRIYVYGRTESAARELIGKLEMDVENVLVPTFTDVIAGRQRVNQAGHTRFRFGGVLERVNLPVRVSKLIQWYEYLIENEPIPGHEPLSGFLMKEAGLEHYPLDLARLEPYARKVLRRVV